MQLENYTVAFFHILRCLGRALPSLTPQPHPGLSSLGLHFIPRRLSHPVSSISSPGLLSIPRPLLCPRFLRSGLLLASSPPSSWARLLPLWNPHKSSGRTHLPPLPPGAQKADSPRSSGGPGPQPNSYCLPRLRRYQQPLAQCGGRSSALDTTTCGWQATAEARRPQAEVAERREVPVESAKPSLCSPAHWGRGDHSPTHGPGSLLPGPWNDSTRCHQEAHYPKSRIWGQQMFT